MPITILERELRYFIRKPDVNARTVVFSMSPLEKSSVNNIKRMNLQPPQKEVEDKVQKCLFQSEALSECYVYLDETDCKQVSARRELRLG